VFFPVNSPHQNNEAFHMLMHHLSPILDVAHLSLWDHEKVYGLSTKLSVIFAKKLQCAVGEYLHNQLSVPVVSSEVLCNLVDELHVALRECTTLCQDFFQRLWLSYLKTVVEIVDDPVRSAVLIQTLLFSSVIYANKHCLLKWNRCVKIHTMKTNC
jgi:hypothetical protein